MLVTKKESEEGNTQADVDEKEVYYCSRCNTKLDIDEVYEFDNEEANVYCEKCYGELKEIDDDYEEQETDNCLLCGGEFTIGEDGNELGFCCKCSLSKDFPYDLDKYYEAYEKNEVAFKGFDTMSRGLLEKYRKVSK